MANMTRFIDTVSLGIELGREMRGQPAKIAAAVIGKPSKKGGKRKGKKVSKKAKEAGPTFAQKIAKVMGRRTMSAGDVAADLKKAGEAPKSKGLRAYISTTFSSAKDEKGKRMFTSPSRGLYFVTAKMSAREVARKAKGAKKAAKKVKAKAAKKANGKAEATSATAAAQAPN
jgi:hypothetical protein